MSGLDPRHEWRNRVNRATELPASVRHVAGVIADELGYQLVGTVAVAQIMLLTGLSYRAVTRATARLRRDGWLTVLRRGGRGHASRLQLDVPGLLRRVDVPQLGTAWAPDRVPGGESQVTGGTSSGQLMPPVTPVPAHQMPSVAPDRVPGGESQVTGGTSSGQLMPPVAPFLEVSTYVPTSLSQPQSGREAASRPALLAAATRADVEQVIEALPAHLVPENRRQFAALVAQRLDAGWDGEQLAAYYARQAGSIDRARTPGLFGDYVPVRPPASARPRAELPPWCGDCYSAERRLIELDDGREARCPACHPLAVAARVSS